jgi:hypothetical protein
MPEISDYLIDLLLPLLGIKAAVCIAATETIRSREKGKAAAVKYQIVGKLA